MNNNNDEEVLLAAERDLSDDAEWKRIQKNTFTRWINEHLKQSNKSINDLQIDLQDGIILCNLLEALSGKSVGKYTRKPKFIMMKLENVSKALQFLEEKEHIKIVNIDSSDIVGGKLKLTLGLVWTMILHYSISSAVIDDGDKTKTKDGPTPKQRLLDWLKEKVPDAGVSNFSHDWNDGIAVGALVDSIAPGLCPDWDTWDPQDAFKNAQEAMQLGEDWLSIPQLISPEDMTNPKVDDLSMMTYLSQFPQCKLKEGAPLRPKTNPSKVKVYGPGVEPEGCIAALPANFVVETFSAGNANVEATVTKPNGVSEQVDLKYNDDAKKTYSASYTPDAPGNYIVKVHYADKEVPNSPFNVHVSDALGDPSKVTVRGPGVNPTGLKVDEYTFFEVIATDAGNGHVEVSLFDPEGDKIPTELSKDDDNVNKCRYRPLQPGKHIVNVTFGGEHIPDSPFIVETEPACYPNKVKVSGRGVQYSGIRVGDEAVFLVDVASAGVGVLDTKVIDPQGYEVPLTMTPIEEDLYEFKYKPKAVGHHNVEITYGNREILRSPYDVEVGQKSTNNTVFAYGPGLEYGVCDQPANFTVETQGYPCGGLGFSIEGTSEAVIETVDNKDGSCAVQYTPMSPGEYAVHITCDDEDIVGSPFMAHIDPKVTYDAGQVIAYGAGLQREGVVPNKSTDFVIDTKPVLSSLTDNYKPAVSCSITAKNGDKIKPEISDNADGTYNVTYKPDVETKYTVYVDFEGLAIKDSPFIVNVATKIDVSSIELQDFYENVYVNSYSAFTVDASTIDPLGNGEIKAIVTAPSGRKTLANIVNNNNGKYSVMYSPKEVGHYTIDPSYNGIPIPQSPLGVDCIKGKETARCSAYGPGLKGGFTNIPQSFTVSTKNAGPGGLGLQIQGPAETKNSCKSNKDSTCCVDYTATEPGEYQITVKFCNEDIPGSPFTAIIKDFYDATAVKVSGEGINDVVLASEPTEFKVDTREAGKADLACTITDPYGRAIPLVINDQGNGVYDILYTPTDIGVHKIDTKYGGDNVECGCVEVKAVPTGNATLCKVGEYYQPEDEDIDPSLTIDTSKAGKGMLTAKVTGPNEEQCISRVETDNLGNAIVRFKPTQKGEYIADLKFGGQPLMESPVPMLVEDQNELKRTRAYPVDLKLPFNLSDDEHMTGDVKMPSGNTMDATVINNRDGTVQLKFNPVELGLHELYLKKNGTNIPEKPLYVWVDSKKSRCVRAYGPGLTYGIVGTPALFSLETKWAGKAALSVAIEGTSETEINVNDNHDGTCDVSYVPSMAGEYKIIMKMDEDEIIGSPFTAKISNKDTLTVNTPNDVVLSTTESDIDALYATITAPNGKETPCRLFINDDQNLSITFLPKEVGLHHINVLKDNHHIKNSPFPVFVSKAKTADPSKVYVYGKGIHYGLLNNTNSFFIDAKNAGSGNLGLSIEGPSKTTLKCESTDDGIFHAFYRPTVPGEYKINVEYVGQHVPGSPFKVYVIQPEMQARCSEEMVPTKISPLEMKVGDDCDFGLNMPPRTAASELSCIVVNPHGDLCNADLVQIDDKKYMVRFVPKENGLHAIEIKHANQHIPGSPFPFTVGPIRGAAGDKVHASGPGLVRGEAGKPGEFTIFAREAGSGDIGVTIEGPSKADIVPINRKDGSVDVEYFPTKPGLYDIIVKFNDKHIADSPFTVYVAEPQLEDDKADNNYHTNITTLDGKPIDVTIPLPDHVSPASLEATVVAPSHETYPAKVKRNKDGVPVVNFSPKETGDHFIHVLDDGQPIVGSPFRVVVREKGADVGDASQVRAYGKGLESGITGITSDFVVDTGDVAAGTASVNINGPSKVSIECDEVDEGYKISYTPLKPGQYTVNIKYGNKDHIPGSPYVVNITGEDLMKQQDSREKASATVTMTTAKHSSSHAVDATPSSADALNVFCEGESLHDGVVGENSFLVNATKVKCDMLQIGVKGPSRPCEEIVVKHIKGGIYRVSYFVAEKGRYVLAIKWGDYHIPGSPFYAKVN